MYSAKEKKVLVNYFTNIDSNIFCLINLPEVIKGTLFSRYSRSSKDLRRLFLDDFYTEKTVSHLFRTSKSDTSVDTKKAEDFYERILVGYGDDSVAELGGVHIAVENVSNITVKVVQDARLGISPLEKSSRYIFFDKKNEKDEYQYYRDPVLLKSPHKKLYISYMNELFDFYSHTVRELYDFFYKTTPREDAPEIAFKASCRGKACDIARSILPMGTLTNMGLYGNGRAFEYLLIKMLAHPLTEVRETAKRMNDELQKVIPAFVKRASNERGSVYQEYLKETEGILLRQLADQDDRRVKDDKLKTFSQNSVKLVEFEKKPLDKLVTYILFKNDRGDLASIKKRVSKMSLSKKETLLKKLVSKRQNRHHKAVRSLENIYYIFEIESDIGAFRDVHRHRILSQERQPYTTEIGVNIPQEIKDAGLTDQYVAMMQKAQTVFKTIYKTHPHEAQYVVPFGFRIRYYFTLNLREAVHFTELRSTAQGHPSYRYIAQQIALQIIKKHPYFKHFFAFVDYKNYKLERLSAFKKIEEKAKKLGIAAFQEEK